MAALFFPPGLIQFCSYLQIVDEEVKLHLEDYDSMQEQLEQLFNDCIGEFPDDDKSETAAYAAQIAQSHITDQTRHGHARFVCLLLCCGHVLSFLFPLSRIIKAYIAFHLKLDPNWDAKTVTQKTPYHVREFITQKCGSHEAGFEGRKVWMVNFLQPLLAYQYYIAAS